MKQLSVLLLIAFAFSACKKEATEKNTIIIEPPFPQTISRDTLTSGQYLGLSIGETNVQLYNKLQGMQTAKNLSVVNVVSNVFNGLTQIQSKIPLYTAVLLDETTGSSTGIQIYFENNKVKSIYTNSGVKINSWPAFGEKSVKVGDAIGDIYQKFVYIKDMSDYANKFERISLFNKDLAKTYDPAMSTSPQWYFTVSITDKRYNVVELNFKDGKLAAIYSTVYQNF